MAQYLCKMTLTNQACGALLENPQDRFEAVKPMIESSGGKLLDYWFALDQGAIYLRIEGIEDLSAVMAIQMAVMGRGTISSWDGTRLLTAKEAMAAFKNAKSLGYQPASSS